MAIIQVTKRSFSFLSRTILILLGAIILLLTILVPRLFGSVQKGAFSNGVFDPGMAYADVPDPGVGGGDPSIGASTGGDCCCGASCCE